MYVDGYVAAVPAANKEAYRVHAEQAAPIFREFGALSVIECWEDDVPEGKVTSFGMAVKKTEEEKVVFSWVTWPDKATRDAGWEKMMADERMKNNTMPFDGQRMIYGGFKAILEA